MEHLRLLASAIAGRTLEVVASGPHDLAWSDGLTIHIPAGMAAQDEVRAVAVQAALIGAGSLAPEVMRRLVRRPAQARRYLASEGCRALSECEDLLPPVARALIDHVGADPPSTFGTLHPRRVLAAAAKHSTPVGAAVSSAEHAGSTPLVALEDEDDGAEPGDDLGGLLSNPTGGEGALGRLLARLLAPARGRSGDGPVGAGTPTHATAQRPGAGRPTALVLRPAAAPADGAAVAAVGTSYPEWDVRRGRYREAWCKVAEHDAPDDGIGAPAMEGAAFRRPLARLGAGLAPARRQRDGDDVDLDAAVEAWVDAAAGANPDDGVYLTKLRRRRDLAVLVLLDTSGSAGEPGTGGLPVHEHQQRAASALVAALHDLGDRVALYGFNSRGRTAVQLLRVKAFDDHLDAPAARRLHGLRPTAYTRLGAAIRHGTAILDARAGTPHRLLVVFSDGLAYDHGYEGRYGEADARRALVEARRRGVGSLCLSVGALGEPAALGRVFGAAAHTSVPRADDLPALIGPLFRGALRSAEAQQRVHQGRYRARQRAAVERRVG